MNTPTLRRNSFLLNFFFKIFGARASGIILATLIVELAFGYMTPMFYDFGFWTVILSFASRVGIIAAGMTLLMASREFDLSVGSVFALVPVLAFTWARAGLNEWVACVVALGIAILCGLLNGFVVTRMGVNSLIATLATMFLYRTFALVASWGGAVSPPENPTFRYIMGAGDVGFKGFSTAVIWWLGVSAVCLIVLSRTSHGNWTLATGGNEGAARAVGVRARRVKMINFMAASFLAGLSGILFAVVRNTIYAVYGVGMELEIIGATVIGGTPLIGGAGTVLGTVFGSTLLGMVYLGISSTIPMMTIPSAYLYEGAVGALIMGATILNVKMGSLKRLFR